MAMRTPPPFLLLAAGLLVLQASLLAAPAEAPRQPMWLTFVNGGQRDIDGEWSPGGHAAVLRRAAAPADALYHDIVYPGVWSGIDARVSAVQAGLKYSFEVKPGADPRVIHLRYSSTSRIDLSDSGEITIEADGAKIVATRPIGYQQINGRRVAVSARFVPFNSDVAFSVGTYDRTQPLVIESVTKG